MQLTKFKHTGLNSVYLKRKTSYIYSISIQSQFSLIQCFWQRLRFEALSLNEIIHQVTMWRWSWQKTKVRDIFPKNCKTMPLSSLWSKMEIISNYLIVDKKHNKIYFNVTFVCGILKVYLLPPFIHPSYPGIG